MKERILVADLPTTYDYIELYPISDLHVGDPEFKEKEFLNFIDYVRKNERAYIITLGDLVNNAIKSSVSNVYNETMSPNQQKKYIVEVLKPVANKIIAMTTGNHEHRNEKEVDNDITQDIAIMLGIEEKYCKNDIRLKVCFGRRKDNTKKVAYTIYANHGYSSGRRIGGVMNNAELAGLNFENVDIYIFGHAHKKAVYKNTAFVFDDKNNVVVPKERYFVLTSAWTGYSGYARRKLLIPSAPGTVKIVLSGEEKKIKVEV